MFGRRLAVGVTLVGGVVLAVLAAAPPVAASTHSAPDASTLYREALGTTKKWSVHYVSSSTVSQVSLLETGDSGPASGTQNVATGKGALTDMITIDVIGGLTYVKGNAGGFQALVGMDAATAQQVAGRWIEFSTTNATFAQVVAGVRSRDVADELELKGHLTLGHATTLGGIAVDAIEGTQTNAKKTERVVLYVRAHGSHVPVEEDAVDSNGKPNGTLHVAYSHWGETVRPEAPQGAVPIGPVSAV
ncbi:MAG TPA: hypothetical protein VMP41_04955 [Acidimicrobiales bacterium]|nr:hypothetical protein [Acidimicrobiales bacterium]